MTTCYTRIDSPVGGLMLAGDGDALTLLSFERSRRAVRPDPAWTIDPVPFRGATEQLRAYFAGERREFQLPIRPAGTPFELEVWAELLRIPYGTTTTYGEIARRIGRPSASRAVGLANGRNPLPIIIPCHRVIGADGSLTGFGGGLAMKRRLLTLEGALGTLAYDDN